MDLAIDGPHRFQIAPVDALAGLEDARPNDVLFDFLERVRELDLVAWRGLLRHKLRDNLGFRLADLRVALLLARDLEGLLEIPFHKLLDLSLVLVLRVRQNPWVFRGLFGKADDGVDNRAVCLLPEGHGAEHHLLGKLLRLRLDHENGVARSRNDEIELGRFHLFRCGVQDELAVRIANPRSADRPKEWHARQRQRRRSRHQSHDVRVALHVVGQHRYDDLRLILEPRCKKRPDRPVDEPGNERFTLRGPAFALKITARNLACSVSLFLIIHGEGEEVLGRVGLAFTDNGCKHRSLPILREHCGVGLPRYAPCLQLESTATPFDFFTINLEHLCYSNSFSRRPVPRLVFASIVCAPATLSAESPALLVKKIEHSPRSTGKLEWLPAQLLLCSAAPAGLHSSLRHPRAATARHLLAFGFRTQAARVIRAFVAHVNGLLPAEAAP